MRTSNFTREGGLLQCCGLMPLTPAIMSANMGCIGSAPLLSAVVPTGLWKTGSGEDRNGGASKWAAMSAAQHDSSLSTGTAAAAAAAAVAAAAADAAGAVA